MGFHGFGGIVLHLSSSTQTSCYGWTPRNYKNGDKN